MPGVQVTSRVGTNKPIVFGVCIVSSLHSLNELELTLLCFVLVFCGEHAREWYVSFSLLSVRLICSPS